MDSFRYKIIREIQLKNNDFFVLIYGFIIKIVSKDVTIAATTFAEYTISLGLSGGWLITGFNPYVNGEMNAFVTSSHVEANNIKISVTNQATGARTINVGAVVDYIQW